MKFPNFLFCKAVATDSPDRDNKGHSKERTETVQNFESDYQDVSENS